MDYTLRSLKDAFQDSYYENKNTYKLYAILLATSLDKDFVLDYMKYFKELHYLTGKELLIIGPQTVPLDISTDDEIELTNALSLLKSSGDPDKKVKVEKAFLEFLNEQTRESYALADFLSLDKSKMPLIIFFERLDSPQNFIIWPLNDLSGREFILEFRKILEKLRTECGWDLDKQIPALEKYLVDFKSYGSFTYPKDISFDFTYELDNYAKSAETVRKYKILHAFYSNLKQLVSEFNKLKDSFKIPYTNVENSLNELNKGSVKREYFDYLQNWGKRWKSKIPKSILESISGLYYPYDFVNNDTMIISETEMNLKYNQAIDLSKSLKTKIISKIELELQLKNREKSEKQTPVLKILKTILHTEPNVIENVNIQDRILQESPIPKKVFISYSHDSVAHKASVLNLAQTLRDDGINCWIDQFEESPELGFTRWMYEQITMSDYVLIACTAIYKAKFEGIELKKASGGNFEGDLILQELNDSGLRNSKFIPVLLGANLRDEAIPLILRSYRGYNIPNEYKDLVSHIHGLKKTIPNSLGRKRFN